MPTTTHPLAYAVLELRVPFSPRLIAEDSISRLSSVLGDLPILRHETRQRLNQAADGSVNLAPEKVWRFLDLGSTRSLIISNAAITYETTHYPGFEQFTTHVRECLKAICEISPPVGFDRLGLRYVNEVRPDHPVRTLSDWDDSVSPNLVASLVELETAVTDGSRSQQDPSRLETAESTLVFSLPQNSALIIKLGNLVGTGVVGNAPLRRYQLPEPGPFFVVDFDGYWPRNEAEVRPFVIEEIVELMGRVHSPVKSAFQWATTDSYREGAGVVNQ